MSSDQIIITQLEKENDQIHAYLEKAEAALCRARDDFKWIRMEAHTEIDNRTLQDRLDNIKKRADAAFSSSALCSHADTRCEICHGGCPDKDHHVTHRLCDECWEHTVKKPITLLQEENARLRAAVEWACDYYPYADAEWFRAELRRRATGGKP